MCSPPPQSNKMAFCASMKSQRNFQFCKLLFSELELVLRDWQGLVTRVYSCETELERDHSVLVIFAVCANVYAFGEVVDIGMSNVQ